ncbi:MAG: DUF5067 domain-containing protein [Bacillota bacterium]|nr:DUF5067 domain-containing protein [Bacillota bacterium]
MKKKILATFLIFAIAFSMVACNGQKEKPEEMEGGEDRAKMLEEAEKNVPEDMEDGYEIVDSINIDTSEISMKYTGHEIIEDVDNDGRNQKRLVIYFDFTNKTSSPMSAVSTFMTFAFQNGIEMQGWGGSSYNESLKNEVVDIMDGATINVAFLYDLKDETSPVKFRIENSYAFEGTESFAQQQEISLQ